MVTNFRVTADSDGCYAWIDSDGSGDLSGIISSAYDSCDSE
jgi:hypothetical protein